MAAKKEETLQAQEPQAEEAKAEEAKAEEAKAQEPVDEWKEEVEMYVPRKAKGDDQSWFVCVNNHRVWVPANGKKQKLPKPVAMILEMAVEAENAADNYINQVNQERMDNARQFG